MKTPQQQVLPVAAHVPRWSRLRFSYSIRPKIFSQAANFWRGFFGRGNLSVHTFEKIDRALAEVGWTFDFKHEEFTNGKRRVSYRQVLALVPGLTLEELASYVEHQYDAVRQ
jgi:hypothetical protein